MYSKVHKMTFTEKQNIKLIRHIKNNPVLYDSSHPHYMDFDVREVVWQKIGDELERSAAECKSRWINIRDIYRRILRRRIDNPGADMKPYKYDNELLFLKPFFRDIILKISEQDVGESNNDDSNIANDTDLNNDDDSGEISEAEKPPRKKASKSLSYRKKRKTRVAKAETPAKCPETPSTAEFDVSDPVDAFLLSIGSTLKTFSPFRLNLAKTQIFSVVQEHDLKQIVQSQNQMQTSDVKMNNDVMQDMYDENIS